MRRAVLVAACHCVLGCSSPRAPAVSVRDAFIDDTSRLARTAFDSGEFESALSLYGRVLQRAYAVDDSAEAGNASYNMAVCYLQLERLDEARAALHDARVEFERCEASILDLLVVEAGLEKRLGHPDRVLELVREVLSAGANDRQRWQVTLLRGAVACDREDVGPARAALAETGAMAVSEPALLALREQLAARVLALEGNHAAAAAAFDREAELYREARRYRAMALALGRAGSAYRQAGLEALAADRLLRSQRSLDAQ